MRPITHERLSEMIAAVPWGSLEKIDDGHFMMIDTQSIDDEFGESVYDFYLRVGLHMGRPVQVVMANGNFMRFRGGMKWEAYPLKQLNPKKPLESLYSKELTQQYGSQYGVIGTVSPIQQYTIIPSDNSVRSYVSKDYWDPAMVYPEPEVAAQQARWMAAQVQAQSLLQQQQAQIQKLAIPTLPKTPQKSTFLKKYFGGKRFA